jgi:hypothetical protein
MTRSLFALLFALLGLCIFLYDAVGFSRREWGVFSQGALLGGVAILLLTQLRWRSEAAQS